MKVKKMAFVRNSMIIILSVLLVLTAKVWVNNNKNSTGNTTPKIVENKVDDEPSGLRRLIIRDNSVLDETGKPMTLVGVTTDEFRFNPMYINIETLKKNLLEVKSWGVNMVVLYLQQPIVVNKRVDEIVDLANWATENSMYTLIFPVVHEDDMVPVELVGRKKEDVTYTATGKNTEMILDTLSKRLKDNVGVLYGMGAEHHNIHQAVLYKRQLEMVDTVRDNSPNSVVVINGMEYGHFLEMYIANPPQQPNILYDLHQYIASSEEYIDIKKCKILNPYVRKLPIIVGEFGGTYKEDFGSYKDLECISNIIFSLKYEKIGFVVHTIDNMSRMGLFDWSNQITSKGKLLKNALSDMKTN